MTFSDLINYGPFVTTTLIACGLLYLLRAIRLAWLGAVLVALGSPGFFIAMKLRDVGFRAYGAECTMQKARGFMEDMQWVFAAQSLAVLVGSTILLGLAFRQKSVMGIVAGIILFAVSCYVAFFIYFAAGMTAVDGYRC